MPLNPAPTLVQHCDAAIHCQNKLVSAAARRLDSKLNTWECILPRIQKGNFSNLRIEVEREPWAKTDVIHFSSCCIASDGGDLIEVFSSDAVHTEIVDHITPALYISKLLWPGQTAEVIPPIGNSAIAFYVYTADGQEIYKGYVPLAATLARPESVQACVANTRAFIQDQM